MRMRNGMPKKPNKNKLFCDRLYQCLFDDNDESTKILHVGVQSDIIAIVIVVMV